MVDYNDGCQWCARLHSRIVFCLLSWSLPIPVLLDWMDCTYYGETLDFRHFPISTNFFTRTVVLFCFSQFQCLVCFICNAVLGNLWFLQVLHQYALTQTPGNFTEEKKKCISITQIHQSVWFCSASITVDHILYKIHFRTVNLDGLKLALIDFKWYMNFFHYLHPEMSAMITNKPGNNFFSHMTLQSTNRDRTFAFSASTSSFIHFSSHSIAHS